MAQLIRSNHLKISETCFVIPRFFLNQASSITFNCPRIRSLWDAGLSNGKKGLDKKQQQTASRLQKCQFVSLPKAAVLLVLPVLGAVAWCFKSSSYPIQTANAVGTLQFKTRSNSQLTDSAATENGTIACEFFSNCLEIQDVQKNLTSGETPFLDAMDSSLEVLPSWEKVDAFRSFLQGISSNRTDGSLMSIDRLCPEAPPRSKQVEKNQRSSEAYHVALIFGIVQSFIVLFVLFLINNSNSSKSHPDPILIE